MSTSPITISHAIGGSLQRYTKVPAALNPGGGDPPEAGGGGGRVTIDGRATAGGGTTPGPATTIYGYNQNTFDNPEQTVAGRMSIFTNRAPCTRAYGGSGLQANFTVSTAVAPEKRVCYSFKAGGGFTSAQLASTSTAAGSARATMKAFLEDVPAGWVLYWVYHHEANSATGFEVPVPDFRGTFDNMMWAKANATLKAGVQVFVTGNLMAYQVDAGIWSDQWVPNCDIMTWDMYGNPGQNTPSTGSNKYGTATGTGYNSQYPLPVPRMAAMFRVTQRTGYAASWGILEVNSPQRNWDVSEAGRASWHRDVIAHFNAGGGMTGGKPPKIVLLWEAPSGANWNQAYGYNIHPAKSPPGTIAKSQTKIDNSPIWDFWRPYIVGTPKGSL